jgi:hypothetical protein
MRILIFLAAFFSLSHARAQDSTLKYAASLVLAGATSHTPYWLHVNQYGSIPTNGNFASGKWSLYKIYHPNDPRLLQWSAGAEVVTNAGIPSNGQFFFTDIFASARLGPVEFLAGQKKSVVGLVDSSLTSGSLAFSGNSRPFPRLQISIPEFHPIAFTNYYIALKASYSDGRLGPADLAYGNTRQIPNTYFHQKQLYLRFGDYHSRLVLYTGINHQAIWGGEDKIWPIYKLTPGRAYWYTITGKSLDYKKIGDHFGSIDIAAQWKSRKWSYYVYRQNIYENSSIFKIINFSDGLTGIRLKKLHQLSKRPRAFKFQSLVVEYINTRSQTNEFSNSNLVLFQNANYFNHYIYKNGWSYYGRSIGTPLIPPSSLTREEIENSKSQFTNTNRNWAVHGAMSARWLNCSILFKGTYSHNLGTYLLPYDQPRNQLSFLLSAEKNIPFFKNSTFITSIASDIGKLYPNSTSLLIGIRKNGYLN